MNSCELQSGAVRGFFAAVNVRFLFTINWNETRCRDRNCPHYETKAP